MMDNGNTMHEKTHEALAKCATIYSNLGSTSTKEEWRLAKKEEREILEAVRDYDKEVVDRLLNAMDL